MQNFDYASIFRDPVVNPNRRVKDLPQVGTLRNRRSDVRKLAQQLNVVENGYAEVLCRSLAVAADVVENAFQVS